jgi:hypothetical protein
MGMQVLIQQVGPLPIKVAFNAPSDSPMYLEVNGSVWSQNANTMIGISVQLDGSVIGKAQIFSNGSSTHRAVVPAYFPVKMQQGQHTIVLDNSGGVSDYNDFYTATLYF